MNSESKKEQVQLRFERARRNQSEERDRNEKRAETMWHRVYWAVFPIFLLGILVAMGFAVYTLTYLWWPAIVEDGPLVAKIVGIYIVLFAMGGAALVMGWKIRPKK